ncbi:MAG: hypothetical protein SOY42_10190 [Clostridium sp.]|nr:hypothetical protein [Clostridium sp.]
MKITNRLYTYPILSEEKDDYLNSKFEVQMGYIKSVNSIELKFEFYMDNKELEQLIRDGKAEYVIHLECSYTTFRKALSSSTNEIKYEIPISKLNGKLEMVAFIVAKENLVDFYSDDWNEDFEGLKFKIPKAGILAYKNFPPMNILKDFEEFTNASSIFSVCKRQTDEDKPIEVNLNSDKIKIILGPKEYDIFAKFQNNNKLLPIFHSMLILPAFVSVFEELKKNIELYKEQNWFISLEYAYEKRGLNLIKEITGRDNLDDIEDRDDLEDTKDMEDVENNIKSSFELAQKAMDLPIGKAFSQIINIYEDTEEEDL